MCLYILHCPHKRLAVFIRSKKSIVWLKLYYSYSYSYFSYSIVLFILNATFFNKYKFPTLFFGSFHTCCNVFMALFIPLMLRKCNISRVGSIRIRMLWKLPKSGSFHSILSVFILLVLNIVISCKQYLCRLPDIKYIVTQRRNSLFQSVARTTWWN